MDGWLYRQVGRIATWPVVALLVIAFLVCIQAFEWRKGELGYENKVLDQRTTGYTPPEVRGLFDNLGRERASLYATTQLTLDLIFPVVYGALLGILIYQLYRPEYARHLLLVPFLAVIADLLENITTAYLAWSFDRYPEGVAWLAATFTVTKAALLVVSLILVLVGGVLGLFRVRGAA